MGRLFEKIIQDHDMGGCRCVLLGLLHRAAAAFRGVCPGWAASFQYPDRSFLSASGAFSSVGWVGGWVLFVWGGWGGVGGGGGVGAAESYVPG